MPKKSQSVFQLHYVFKPTQKVRTQEFDTMEEAVAQKSDLLSRGLIDRTRLGPEIHQVFVMDSESEKQDKEFTLFSKMLTSKRGFS